MVNDLPINVGARSRIRQPLGGTPPVLAYFIDDNVYNREGDAFWVRGESSADILLRARDRSPRRTPPASSVSRSLHIGKLTAILETGPKPNRVVISTGGERARHRHGAELAADRSSWRCRTACRTSTIRAFRPTTSTSSRISSSTGFVPMFENGANDSRFLGVMVRLIPTYGDGTVVATIAVVTSSPPFAEGGHLVMARELVRALREEGHDTGLVVTPQNRFGQQGSAYLAAWCTDVAARARGAQGRSGDQPAVSRLRGAASQSRAVAQPPACASTTICGISSARTCRGRAASRNARGAR